MVQKIIEKYRCFPLAMKASMWFLICSFMQKAISIITTPIFTRLMSAAEYGRFNVFTAWQGIITIFVSLNLSWGVYNQGLVKYEADRKVFSSSMNGLTLLLITVWTVFYLVTREFWNSLLSLNTEQMLAMLVIIWTTASFEFWASEQRAELKYLKLVTITLIASVFAPISGIVLVMTLKDKATARIMSLAITGIVVYTGLFIKQIRRRKKLYSKKYWSHALAFNIPLIPHYLSQTVLNSADRIMIERMVNAETAGIYSLAYSISLIMTLFNTALMQTISPWLYRKIRDNEIEDISNIAYPALIFIGTVNLILIAFAPEVVAMFAPKSYLDAIWVIPPIALSVYFMFAYDLFAKFEFYYEKTKLIAIATVMGAILNIILNYFFIGKYGYYAAGYTTLMCYLVYAVIHYVFMRKICCEQCAGKQPYNNIILFKITAIFTFVSALFLLLYKHPLLRYLVIIIMVLFLLIKRNVLMEEIRKCISKCLNN
ncbi:lipopolysaccharide biosynthesis protein [Clostridium transplantifaecale]|uniref:lipopolysaccharide biosynthesis protein n=1 Tax=Clostridium transplantifaecale TaxID=2479838 RepID=UPI000F63E8A8|nr:oligosaccharide flippase family protein [Clostridium transplantifaecale]